MIIKVNQKELFKLERDLRIFAKEAFPFAERQTINDGAFFALKTAKKKIRREFQLRNTWTGRRILVDKARSLKSPVARVGSLDPYMELQEFGGVKRKAGKHGVAIPTTFSSGEGEDAKKRKKIIRPRNRLQRIKIGKTKAVNPAIQIREAAARGYKTIFLELSRGKKGIFRIVGGKRKPKIKMLYDLSRSSVVIPRSPWLLPATLKAERRMEAFYVRAIEFQLKRRGLFTGK